MKRVYICSPLRGKDEAETQRNKQTAINICKRLKEYR